MKVKSGYMLREIAGHYVVLPLGTRVVEFNGVITLNGTGAFLWENMASDVDEEALVGKMTSEYGVDTETAANDIREFVQTLKEKGLLEAQE